MFTVFDTLSCTYMYLHTLSILCLNCLFCTKSHGPMHLNHKNKKKRAAAENKDKLLTANALMLRDQKVHYHGFQHQLRSPVDFAVFQNEFVSHTSTLTGACARTQSQSQAYVRRGYLANILFAQCMCVIR